MLREEKPLQKPLNLQVGGWEMGQKSIPKKRQDCRNSSNYTGFLLRLKVQLILFLVFASKLFIIQFKSTSAKTFLFLVNCSFFYGTLKFEQFPPSWFMAAY